MAPMSLDEAVCTVVEGDNESAMQPTLSFDEVAQTVDSRDRCHKVCRLIHESESNYKFSYGRMLSLNGITAPYMLYTYAWICGIVRRATGQSEGTSLVWPKSASMILIEHDSERQLSVTWEGYLTFLIVETDLYPNRQCDYLFETRQNLISFMRIAR